MHYETSSKLTIIHTELHLLSKLLPHNTLISTQSNFVAWINHSYRNTKKNEQKWKVNFCKWYRVNVYHNAIDSLSVYNIYIWTPLLTDIYVTKLGNMCHNTFYHMVTECNLVDLFSPSELVVISFRTNIKKVHIFSSCKVAPWDSDRNTLYCANGIMRSQLALRFVLSKRCMCYPAGT